MQEKKTTSMLLCGLVAFASLLCSAAQAQVRMDFRRQQPDEVAGTIRLQNGMLVSGVCSNVKFFETKTGSRSFEMRLVNQSLRKLYVATRNSDPVVPNNGVLPIHKFEIRQKRTGRRPLSLSIGLHQPPVFGPDGLARMELNRGDGRMTTVELGITELNEKYATVSALNYKHEFGVSMKRLPDAVLYSGSNRPGLVRLIQGFDDVNTQLNVAQMLIQTEKFSAASQLLEDLENADGDIGDRVAGMYELFQVAISERALVEMNRQLELGQRERLKMFLRRWPDEKLSPLVRVKVKTLSERLTEQRAILDDLKDSIDRNLAAIQDPVTRQLASRMRDEMWSKVTPDHLGQFDSYQVLSLDENLAPESKLALAISGWILGAESAIDDFEQTAGLFEARILVQDYLAAPAEAVVERNAMLDQMRSQEGFSAARLAQLLKHIPPSGDLPRLTGVESVVVPLPESERLPKAVVCLPPEYTSAKSYPLLLAFPAGGQSLATTVALWRAEAARFGYVVVCPDIFSAENGTYKASAEDMVRLRELMLYVKSHVRVDDDRVFTVGHGIGSEAAIDVATSWPDVFAGVVSIAGLGRDHLLWTARNAPELSWLILTGSRQPSLVPRFGSLRSKLFQRDTRRQYLDVVLINYTGRGFEPYSEAFEEIFEWMQLQRRTSPPEKIVAKALRSSDRHWYWLDLEPLPTSLATMDDGGDALTKPRKAAAISAETTATGFRLQSVPIGGFIRLLQGTPAEKLEGSISVIKGGRSKKVTFQPSARDLLEDFAIHRDRKRLCLMRIPIP